MCRNIFSAQRDIRSFQSGLALCQIGERDADCQIAVNSGQPGLDAVKQFGIHGKTAIHFPVSDDQFTRHAVP